MSRAQTLARLQTLLTRVRARARQPGEPGEVEVDSVPPLRDPFPAAPAATPISSLPPIDLQDDGMPIATAEMVSSRPPSDAHEDETRMPVVNPASTAPPRDLREEETPIAAAGVADDVATLTARSLAAQSSAPPRRIGVEPVFDETRNDTLEPSPADELADDEGAEDRAPASSRRPVAGLPTEPPLDQLAFDSEEALPALHTPPPESGKVPAAPDITDYDRDLGDVENQSEGSQSAERVFDSAPEELVPETTRPTFDATVAVAQFVGQAVPFAPTSFLALLDATLGL